MNGAGGGSPFVFSMGGGGPRFARGGAHHGHGAGRSREAALPCTLEELYRGAKKKVQANGSEYDIDVKPGWKAGTKIDFGAGASFVVREQKHQHFSRVGNDLTYWAEVAPSQLLTGSRQRIKTLDGRFIAVEFAPLAFWTVRVAPLRPVLCRQADSRLSARAVVRSRHEGISHAHAVPCALSRRAACPLCTPSLPPSGRLLPWPPVRRRWLARACPSRRRLARRASSPSTPRP